MKRKNSHTKSVNHFYQNPVFSAKQNKHLIDSGEGINANDLALIMGISKVCVSRVLSLLKLNPDLIEAVEKPDNPMPLRIVTKKCC